MAINFPTSLDTLSNPTGSDLLENAVAALDHDVQHSNANDAIEALEAKVGADGSAVTTSHDYKLSEVTTTDKAVSKTATQTLTNKTLTAPQINFGSDATGDMIIRSGAGVTSRLAIGTTDQILSVQAGVPTWIANPSAAPASTTVAGIVELATTAETLTGTDDTRAVTPKGIKDAGYIITPTDIQTFTSDDTWTKPAGAKSVLVQVWGAGGSGGGAGNGTGAAGGGGGGSYSEWTFNASDLSSTEAIVVGVGQAGGVGSADGTVGEDSSFGTTKVVAYGGGGGSRANAGSGGGAGGGAGISAVGSTASNTSTGATGGAPSGGTAGTAGSFGGGGGGGNNVAGGLSVYGGGGGGGGSSSAAKTGGSSVYGGGGGGGAYTTGGAGGTSLRGGAGGAGGNDNSNGTAGSIPGGGGGGAYSTSGAFNGGAGARGQIIVTTYF